MKHRDGSLTIGTGYNYVIGDLRRQREKCYIREWRLDNVIIIYGLFFFCLKLSINDKLLTLFKLMFQYNTLP